VHKEADSEKMTCQILLSSQNGMALRAGTVGTRSPLIVPRPWSASGATERARHKRHSAMMESISAAPSEPCINKT
jgi:hypothetical protein